jgi:hypothetical protein
MYKTFFDEQENMEVTDVRWKIFSVLVMLILLAVEGYGASLEPFSVPSLVSSLKNLDSLEFCGELVPREVPGVRERLEKELLLTIWDRPQVILWLKRSRRYFPQLEKMLKENKMPDDLKYIAIVESALRPHAGSGKGAVGFWQFMVDTGRKYGLVINDRTDERRNFFASTRAAIRYFNDLHKLLGTWTLAAAAFNMGEEGLQAEIMVQETRDYYRLYLSLETQRFIFRILSAKLIFADPVKFGFSLTDEDYYSALSYDQINIDCFQEIPIQIVAQAAETDFKVIKDLNPELRGHYFVAGNHNIFIPKGVSENFHARYKHLVKAYLSKRKERVYIVKKGDNLSSIAAQFDIPLAALIIWNRLELNHIIYPEDRLVIYPKRKNN